VTSPAVEGLAEYGLPTKEDETELEVCQRRKETTIGVVHTGNARRVSRVPIYMNV
jgi:hypothetical protein